MNRLAIMTARKWLGTPFIENASVCGVGADCAGLIEGIARELNITSPSRAQIQGDILRAAQSFLRPSLASEPSCVILLARDPGGEPLHAAIVTEAATLIHAHWRAGVVENRFGSWFTRRVTHVFAWPAQTIPN
jgi:NlpC/P60 family putative phage cell wall peptidase